MFEIQFRAAIVKIAAYFIALFCFFYLPAVFAQAEVVDPIPLGGTSTRSISPSSKTTSQNQNQDSQISAEFFYQFQALQQEVMQLRGLMEEQAHEIKKLKQQRLDDYIDLDRRIGQSRGAGSEASATQTTSDPQLISSTAPAPADELKGYREAIDLLLKQQDQDGAIAALNKHLQDYPQGRYAANAQYWLGETYLLKGDLAQANKWFTQLINEYPGHNKVPDAKFKLGKVYDLQGDKVKARQMLDDVAQSGTSAAGLAKDYINNKL